MACYMLKNMEQLYPYCSGNLQKLPYLESGYLPLAVFQRPQTPAENSWSFFPSNIHSIEDDCNDQLPELPLLAVNQHLFRQGLCFISGL